MFKRGLKCNVKEKLVRKEKVYTNLNNLIINVIKINND